MKTQLLLTGIFSLAIIGCGSGSGSNLTGSSVTAEVITAIPETDAETEGTVAAMFAGATFVLIKDGESLLVDDADTSVVSFTYDTVTWVQSDGQETGAYVRGDTYPWVASFAGYDVEFQPSGSALQWGTEIYSRTGGSSFNSQENMVGYLSGSTYNTVELFDGGETVTGEVAQANWSVQFDDNNIYWSVRDTVSIGQISYVDDSTFTASFNGNEKTIVVLNESQLVIDSILYEKEPTIHFTSQETMVAYLNNASYLSDDLKPLGETVDGTVALGHWRIDFTSDTFNWFYQDIAEAGTYSFVDENQLTLQFFDREYDALISENYLTFDGVRYQRTVE